MGVASSKEELKEFIDEYSILKDDSYIFLEGKGNIFLERI